MFITDATSSFGMATARRFAAEGWQTVISGRRGERLDALKAELPTPCHAAVLDVTDKAAVTSVETNVMGVLYCTKAILPQMIDNGYGHIVNISSIAGYWPYPDGNVYGATKAFVRQFSLNLRADLVAKNIHVTDVEPGLSETEFSQVRFKGDAEKASQVYKDIDPMQPADIADAVFWAATRPKNVNINRIEMMAGCQAFAGFNVVRGL